MLHRRQADSSRTDSDSDKSSSDKALQRPEIGRAAAPLVLGGQGRTDAEVEDDTWGFVGLLLGTLAALAVVAAAVGVMVWVTGGGR